MRNRQRLRVEHETHYRYVPAVDMGHHIACLRPLSDAGQDLLAYQLDIQPEPTQHATQHDAFGNSRTYFALHAEHEELLVRATSVVEVSDRYAGMDPQQGPSCGDLRARLAYHRGAPFEAASEFAHASPFVPLLPILRDYAAPSLPDERPVAAAAIDLMQRIARDFRYATASTDISTPLAQVFEQRQGVCQDFAHLMIACLRGCGLAARYVSGYLLTQPPPGSAPLLGADASHAWVSVWCPGLHGSEAWLDLDPTNNCIPSLQHVRVAHGRDFGDVTPLRGVIRGGARHTLTVRVTTQPLAEGG